MGAEWFEYLLVSKTAQFQVILNVLKAEQNNMDPILGIFVYCIEISVENVSFFCEMFLPKIDYDVCSNYGNWLYSAGVGNDPRENRKFNMIKQGLDYDSNVSRRRGRGLGFSFVSLLFLMI